MRPGHLLAIDAQGDAPYRETADQLRLWADCGIVAVEMQAASLFAFAHARSANVAMVALVSNSVDSATEPFDTGGHRFRTGILAAIARGAHAFIKTAPEHTRATDVTRQE